MTPDICSACENRDVPRGAADHCDDCWSDRLQLIEQQGELVFHIREHIEHLVDHLVALGTEKEIT